MKDIARDLGVSVVTVSKVLRNHSDIGEETRQRVLQRIKELRYRPNLSARSLVTGRTFLVGLVVPDLLHPFFAEIAKALSSTLRKKEYYLIISSSEEDPELEEREIDQLLGRRLDALIIASVSPGPDILRRIEDQGTPYVLIDRRFPNLSASFVGVDDEAVGRLATEHLIEARCKRIAHIRGRENSVGNQRLAGYRRALEAHGRRVPEEYVVVQNNVDVDSRESGRQAMERLLRLPSPPDGVFCYNDPLAMGAMDCILDAGLRIPQDIAVIGCGNLHYDSSLRVPLSSIDQHSVEIGERAAKLVLRMVENKTAPPPKSIILQPSVVARLSTQRPTRSKSGPAAKTERADHVSALPQTRK